MGDVFGSMSLRAWTDVGEISLDAVLVIAKSVAMRFRRKDVDDICQVVSEKFEQLLHNGTIIVAPRSYFARLTENHCKDLLRRERRVVLDDGSIAGAAVAPAPAQDDGVATNEADDTAREIIKKFLKNPKLEPHVARIFELILAGEDYCDARKRVYREYRGKVPDGTLRGQFSRRIAELRELLLKAGINAAKLRR